MIFYLLSNFVYRYHKCDDTLSLPYTSNDRYLLAGDFIMVSDAVFKKTVENLVPMLRVCPSALKIVTPPLATCLTYTALTFSCL
jgi:hypothetical protein